MADEDDRPDGGADLLGRPAPARDRARLTPRVPQRMARMAGRNGARRVRQVPAAPPLRAAAGRQCRAARRPRARRAPPPPARRRRRVGCGAGWREASSCGGDEQRTGRPRAAVTSPVPARSRPVGCSHAARGADRRDRVGEVDGVGAPGRAGRRDRRRRRHHPLAPAARASRCSTPWSSASAPASWPPTAPSTAPRWRRSCSPTRSPARTSRRSSTPRSAPRWCGSSRRTPAPTPWSSTTCRCSSRAARPGYGAVIVVDVDPEVAIARLVAHRGFAEADARARIANQVGRAGPAGRRRPRDRQLRRPRRPRAPGRRGVGVAGRRQEQAAGVAAADAPASAGTRRQR